TTLIIIGVWAFLKGLKQPKFWWISAVSLALSVYAYHSSKLFVPLMAVVFGWVARKKILSHKYYVISGLLLFGLIVSPLIPFSLTPEGQLRFKGTSVFNTPTLVDLNHNLKIEQWRAGREYQAKLFHNELFVGLQVFLRGYFSHFTYDLLFFGEYGPPKNQTPNVGLLYL